VKIIRFLRCVALFVVIFALPCVQAGCYELEKGEKLTYAVKFLYIIPLGSLSIEVKDKVDYSGEAVYCINCEGKTAKWISLVFKAEVVLNSYVGARSLYPRKFEQILKIAGKPDDIRRATYDRVANIMEAEGKGRKKVPPDVRDPISAIYYLRAQDLNEGLEINQTVNNNQNSYIFSSKVIGKKKIGKFNCWVLDSKIRRENKSMYHRMDAVIYLSDDAKRVPVLIQAKTNVGPIMLKLKQ